MTDKEIRNTSFYKKLSKVAESNGYHLNRCFFSSKYGEYEVTLKEVAKYAPQIKIVDSVEFDYNPSSVEFKLQTTSFGALKGDELYDFILDTENAYELIGYLENLDWSECPTLDEDARWLVK